MKLPFLSNQTASRSSSSTNTISSTWPWPSCTQTRTLSFRTSNDNIFKTVNSAFLDTTTTPTTTNVEEYYPRLGPFFTNSSSSDQETTHDDHHNDDDNHQSPSFNSTTASEEDPSGTDPVEEVIKGLRSERLFFKPDKTSSILEEAKDLPALLGNSNNNNIVPFKESVALSMESKNPYLDFKKSMEEMVEALGIKEWEGLEELLCWYLKMNGKDNRGYIVGAFVDLLVGLAFNNNNNIIKSCNNSCDSPFSPLSFCNTSKNSASPSSSSCSSSTTTPCVSSIGVGEEIETPCLSSLLESTEEKEDDDDDEASS